jgi:hypothetical protein
VSGFLPYLLAAVGLCVVVALVLVLLAYRRNRSWRRFAIKYRFNCSQGRWLRKPVVYGEIQGRAFRLSKIKESLGADVMGLETVEMSMGLLGYVPTGLEIARRQASEVTQGPSTPNSSGTIKSGDEAFDQAVAVKGAEPAEATNYMTAGRRQAILELLSVESADWAGVRDERAVLVERGMAASMASLERRFQFLFDLVKRLDG